MKTKKRVLPALVLSLFATAGSLQAQGAQFSNVVIFGDSLSDAGYYRPFLAAAGVPSPLVSQLGRFTTNPGPVWSELISQYYGVTPAPSNAGGSIYAQGGARVALTPGITPQGLPERPVSTQITEYLSSHGGAADPNALFAIWAGANDFFVNNTLLQSGAINATQFQANILGAAAAEVQQTGRLFGAGAHYVMVVLNFDAAMTPGALLTLDAATRAGLTQLTAGANTTMLAGLASNNLRAIPVDLFSLFNEIRATPAAFGFTNVTGFACGPFPPFTSTPSAQFCLVGQNVVPNGQNTYLFADPTGHLTTAGNRIVAQFAESLIEGPTAYSLLAEVPLRTRGLHVQTLNDGLLTARQQELGRWNLFAAAAGGHFNIDPGIGNSGLDSASGAYTVGTTLRASPEVVVGLAVGQTRTSASFGQGMGGFHTRENTISLFGAVNVGNFYATGVASTADIDFRDTHRDIVLGALTRTATSSPKGSNTSAYLSAGYDFHFGRIAVGPLVSLTAQSVTVDGFSEDGAGAANLRIFDQKRRSEVWSAGIRATFDAGNWTPWVRVTADKEQKNDARFVTAMPLSVAATGNTYDIPAYASDSGYVTVAGGVRAKLAERVGLSLSLFTVSGRSGVRDEGATALVSVAF
jgi:outer membrane lipase/esterase